MGKFIRFNKHIHCLERGEQTRLLLRKFSAHSTQTVYLNLWLETGSWSQRIQYQFELHKLHRNKWIFCKSSLKLQRNPSILGILQYWTCNYIEWQRCSKILKKCTNWKFMQSIPIQLLVWSHFPNRTVKYNSINFFNGKTKRLIGRTTYS